MLYRSLGIVEAVASDDPEVVSVPKVEAVLDAAIRALDAQDLSRPISLALVSDDRMREMNLLFRGVDATTDVLTFGGEGAQAADIAIAAGALLRQAHWRGVSPADEAALLAIHAALHLEGYDDVEPGERAAMQRETKRRADALRIPCEQQWISLPHDLEVGA